MVQGYSVWQDTSLISTLRRLLRPSSPNLWSRQSVPKRLKPSLPPQHPPKDTDYLHRTTWRYHKDKVIEERKESIPLFLLPKDHQYGMCSPRSPLCYKSLSPDGKFYCFETLEAAYCGKVEPRSKPIVLKSWHRLIFSPDSRFLCGCGSTDDTERDVMVVVECATRCVRRLATLRCPAESDGDYSCTHRFGWYPDSRYIWYQEDLPGLRRDYRRVVAYKQDVVSGRRRVLRGRDLDAVYNDWEMLNPRYRYGDSGMDGDRAFVYTPCQRVRVRVEPISTTEHQEAGLQQVWVESRDGRSRVVIERRRHEWHSILPLDVTEDGRWVLLSVLHMPRSEELPVVSGQGFVGAHSELLAVDTLTGRRYCYVRRSPTYGHIDGGIYETPTYSFLRSEGRR
jgi:hypothetical protein